VTVTNTPLPVSGSVTVANGTVGIDPANNAVSGTVGIDPLHNHVTATIDNFPNPVPVTGGVNVNNLPSIQPVSGSVNIGNFPATQSVNGTVAATQSGPWTVKVQSPTPFYTSCTSFVPDCHVNVQSNAVIDSVSFDYTAVLGVLVTACEVLDFTSGAQVFVPATQESTPNQVDFVGNSPAHLSVSAGDSLIGKCGTNGGDTLNTAWTFSGDTTS
jgi:hypothetical protein